MKFGSLAASGKLSCEWLELEGMGGEVREWRENDILGNAGEIELYRTTTGNWHATFFFDDVIDFQYLDFLHDFCSLSFTLCMVCCAHISTPSSRQFFQYYFPSYYFCSPSIRRFGFESFIASDVSFAVYKFIHTKCILVVSNLTTARIMSFDIYRRSTFQRCFILWIMFIVVVANGVLLHFEYLNSIDCW